MVPPEKSGAVARGLHEAFGVTAFEDIRDLTGGLGSNPVFRIKLILVATGVLNAAAFHQWPFKSVDGWNVGASAPAWAKATALISLVCWSAAIACGRLLAYF